MEFVISLELGWKEVGVRGKTLTVSQEVTQEVGGDHHIFNTPSYELPHCRVDSHLYFFLLRYPD